MIIFLSLKYFTFFFFMKLLMGYLKRFPLETQGGQVDKSMYAMGGRVVTSVHLRTMGEGVKFLPFWCVCTN